MSKYIVTFITYGDTEFQHFNDLGEALAFIETHLNSPEHGEFELFKEIPVKFHIEI